MIRKKVGEEKSRPGVNFILFIPIKYNISTSQSVLEKLDFAIANCNKSRSEGWRSMIFELLKVKDEKELVEKDNDVKRVIDVFKTTLDKKMHISLRGRSNVLLNEMKKKYLKDEK